jgi:predicted membrane protein (TIGR00267 family)
LLKHIRSSLRLTGAHAIVRRYLVVNGFDGALTMLGLIVGFYMSGTTDMAVVVAACIGAAVALAVSGFSSAYISEMAEKQKELQELERAMIRDLGESIHGRASRILPFIVAIVNGMSPFIISLIIISPIWAATLLIDLPLPPLIFAFVLSLLVLFALGIYLGTVSNMHWLRSGLRALLIALITSTIIVILDHLK